MSDSDDDKPSSAAPMEDDDDDFSLLKLNPIDWKKDKAAIAEIKKETKFELNLALTSSSAARLQERECTGARKANQGGED